MDGHDCVVCPYHGWAFDADGVLRDVPAAVHDGEWPRKALVEAYPVAEAGGFVWLFYGSPSLPAAERPPLPCESVPELADPTWKAVYGEIEFACDHWGVFENAIDMVGEGDDVGFGRVEGSRAWPRGGGFGAVHRGGVARQPRPFPSNPFFLSIGPHPLPAQRYIWQPGARPR